MLFYKKYDKYWTLSFCLVLPVLRCLYLKQSIFFVLFIQQCKFWFCIFMFLSYVFFSFQIVLCIFLAQWLSCCCWATKFHNYHLGIGSRHFQSRNVLERKTFSFTPKNVPTLIKIPLNTSHIHKIKKNFN